MIPVCTVYFHGARYSDARFHLTNEVYMNQSDYNRITKAMRMQGIDDATVSAVVGILQAGRISTTAARMGDWDRLLRSAVAQVASVNSGRRSHTGILRSISERQLAQTRAARDAISNASLTGKNIGDFTIMEDDGVTPRNTRVWWTWVPKPERDALQDELDDYYGQRPGKRIKLYRDDHHDQVLESGMARWKNRIETLRDGYATPKTRKSIYPVSTTRKGAFMLGIARRLEREIQQRATLGEDIPQGLNNMLPPALYARTLQASAIPDDHTGMDAMLDIKGFEDFYQP